MADWWRDAVIYQVYPRSFADASGDGIGDIAGIRSRLPYLAGLGVDAIWVSPWYLSPQVDGGYDVADFRQIDPLFGDVADAEALIRDAHDLGLRVIADIVPNHVSESTPGSGRRSGPAGLAGVVAVPRGPGRGANGEAPPNDWRSVFGGPAWDPIPIRPEGRPAPGSSTCSTRASPTSTGSTRRCGPSSRTSCRFSVRSRPRRVPDRRRDRAGQGSRLPRRGRPRQGRARPGDGDPARPAPVAPARRPRDLAVVAADRRGIRPAEMFVGEVAATDPAASRSTPPGRAAMRSTSGTHGPVVGRAAARRSSMPRWRRRHGSGADDLGARDATTSRGSGPPRPRGGGAGHQRPDRPGRGRAGGAPGPRRDAVHAGPARVRVPLPGPGAGAA